MTWNKPKSHKPPPILGREEFRRQAQLIRAATAALGDYDAVRLFLNTYHAGLRARPLDLALASADGLRDVEAIIGVEQRRRLEHS